MRSHVNFNSPHIHRDMHASPRPVFVGPSPPTPRFRYRVFNRTSPQYYHHNITSTPDMALHMGVPVRRETPMGHTFVPRMYQQSPRRTHSSMWRQGHLNDSGFIDDELWINPVVVMPWDDNGKTERQRQNSHPDDSLVRQRAYETQEMAVDLSEDED